MQKLLSIGEVAKLKGVGVKALRYYEKIGILLPAYINPETNYRYYSIDQMIIVDMIMMCLELDIPLKDFNNYIKDGKFLIPPIVEYGRKITNERILSLQKSLIQLDNLSFITSRFEAIKHRTGIYYDDLPTRYLLTAPWEHSYADTKSYLHATTELFLKARRLDLIPLYAQGILIKFHEHTSSIAPTHTYYHEQFVFLEIALRKHDPSDITGLFVLPSGHYLCQLVPDNQAESMHNKILTQTSNSTHPYHDFPEGTFLLESDMYEEEIGLEKPATEFQFYIQ